MNVFIKILVGFLFLFTPFAFAATEPWAFSIVQVGVLLAWSLVLCSRSFLYHTTLLKPILYTIGVLIFLAFVQIFFAQTILAPISAWHPITLMRLYTCEHLSLLITYLGVVGLVLQLYPSQQEIKHLLEWMVICALLVSLCAVGLPRGEYIFKLTGFRGGVGPFLNRNHAGVYFAINTLLALGLFFTKGLEFRRSMLSSKQKQTFFLQQLSLAVIVLALGSSTVMTRSRGGMLSLLVGLFAYSFLYAYAIPKQLKRRLKGVFITLIALILTTGWITTHIEEINVFAQRGTHASEKTRRMMYRSAFRALKDYPVWGVGIGAMPVMITSYVEWNVPYYIERLHNDWLEILLGVGYLGAVFILFGLGWFVWRALYLLKRLETRKQLLFIALLSGLIAMSTGSTVDFHFFIPANALLFFALLGITASPSYSHGHVYRRSLGILHKIVILVIVGVSLYIPMQKTIAWRLALFGKGLKKEGKITAYQKALAHYPSPRYALKLGAAYYNASLYTSDLEEKHRLKLQAHQTATAYLRKYPREKELSRLYLKARLP